MLITAFSLFCLEGHEKPLEQNSICHWTPQDKRFWDYWQKCLWGFSFLGIGHSEFPWKNSCNEKHLKVGVSEAGEIEMGAGKQGTQ